MRTSPRSRTFVTLVGALLALQWSLTAQTPVTAKRPLSYDVVDYWKSIQGTRLSEDGQWLAYATSAQSEDGELIVRNVRSGQEFKHARGTSPTFTPDGKFVVFTIAQAKADEENEAAANPAGGETPAAETPAARGGRPSTGSGQGGAAARTPRTGLGIMTLDVATMGQVKTFDKVGSFSLPEKSSTWLAYHKGLGGGGGGRGGRGAGGRGGAAPAGRPSTGSGQAAPAAGGTPAAQGATREKRKD